MAAMASRRRERARRCAQREHTKKISL
jgi:hypothetical protein